MFLCVSVRNVGPICFSQHDVGPIYVYLGLWASCFCEHHSCDQVLRVCFYVDSVVFI